MSGLPTRMSNFIGLLNFKDFDPSEQVSYLQHMVSLNQQATMIRQNKELLSEVSSVVRSNERLRATCEVGFHVLAESASLISSQLNQMQSSFLQAFQHVHLELGKCSDNLHSLLRLAATPVQVAAYNHFEIARDAYRRGLFCEALEELDNAIHGTAASPGYKLEWRFHYMAGTIRLGFVGCDVDLIDLEAARDAFLLAARYSANDSPVDSARSLTEASWVEYCRGNPLKAIEHVDSAIALDPDCPSSRYQRSKCLMHIGDTVSGLEEMEALAETFPHYVYRADDDPDFSAHSEAWSAWKSSNVDKVSKLGRRCLRAWKDTILRLPPSSSKCLLYDIDRINHLLQRSLNSSNAIACRCRLLDIADIFEAIIEDNHEFALWEQQQQLIDKLQARSTTTETLSKMEAEFKHLCEKIGKKTLKEYLDGELEYDDRFWADDARDMPRWSLWLMHYFGICRLADPASLGQHIAFASRTQLGERFNSPSLAKLLSNAHDLIDSIQVEEARKGEVDEAVTAAEEIKSGAEKTLVVLIRKCESRLESILKEWEGSVLVQEKPVERSR